jgi:hypothetical protein
MKECCLCKYRVRIPNPEGLCPFHYALQEWGMERASRAYPGHPDAEREAPSH